MPTNKEQELREEFEKFTADESNYFPCRDRECEGCYGPIDEDKVLDFFLQKRLSELKEIEGEILKEEKDETTFPEKAQNEICGFNNGIFKASSILKKYYE